MIRNDLKLRILAVGIGSIGTRHLRNLASLGFRELSAYRSRNFPPPSDIPESTVIYDNFDEAIRSKPDAVLICNPTSLHLEYSLQALKHGAHVYIEKPIADRIEGTEKLLEAAAQTGRVILIGCQLRCHPGLNMIRTWLREGLIGSVLSVSADVGEYLPDWHPWEDYRTSYAARSEMGGGVLLTLIHEFDYLFWLFGYFESVYAAGGHLTPLEVNAEDTALVTLRSPSGLPIHLRMDYWRKPAVRILNIVGERGQINWDYYKGRATLVHNGSVLRESKLPDKWDRNDMFLGLIKNFFASIRGEEKPLVSLHDGIEVLKIALAAKQSLKEKKAVTLL